MIGRLLKRALIVLVCLIFLLAAFIVFSIRRSFPQTTGQVRLPGLSKRVEIIRDKYGIPHVYASNRDDLYRAQGYIHAQERFWQMDFWRHTGAGRLSELFGRSQLETDQFLRMMGWARVAKVEVERLDATSAAILKSYSEGVNAYLANHQGSKLSLEHGILRLTNSTYKPEPWTPADTAVWGKVMSWDLGMNMSTEILRARLLNHLPPDQVTQLFPSYPAMNPVILPDFSPAAKVDPMLSRMQFQVPGEYLEAIPFNNDPETGIGSNNWVIGGARTNTGKPLLANDPHLDAQMPNIWFQIHLQCVPQSEDCRFDVAGFSMPGVPGVIIGHNQNIAWAFTNIGPDVMDLYVEKIRPENKNQFEVNGTWTDMQLLEEQIKMADGTSEKVIIRSTRHGPVISDFSKNAKEIRKSNGIEMPQDFAIALRWTALEPSTTFPAIWKMNLSRNWEEFRDAASQFDVPSQNLLYADRSGNIGYQFPGRIPIRKGGDGTFPAPGWNDDYEWTGFIPFEELPSVLNPPSGYVATANNAVLSESLPHFFARDWDYGWRAKRIVDLIESPKSPIDMNYMKQMQGDNKNLNAQLLVPVILSLSFNDSQLENAKQLLKGWDYQQHAGSGAAALFEVFWRNLLQRIFSDDLPENMRPGGGSRWVEIVRLLMTKPQDPWWDDRNTTAIETRDQIFKAAFQNAFKELESRLGADTSKWKWGDLHTVTFRNSSYGSSGIKPLEWLFNRGPFATGGGSSVVNATSWDARETYEVTALPSMRMIVDLADFNRSLAIHTTGQSGHPFHPHYIDMAEPWSKVEYHPMLWDRSAVTANAEATMYLIP